MALLGRWGRPARPVAAVHADRADAAITPPPPFGPATRREVGGRSCGQPHPRGSAGRLRVRRRREHTPAMGRRWWSSRARVDVLSRTLVGGGLAAFVLGVYVVVVLGGGALTGHTDSPQLWLSVVATAV